MFIRAISIECHGPEESAYYDTRQHEYKSLMADIDKAGVLHIRIKDKDGAEYHYSWNGCYFVDWGEPIEVRG